MNIQIEGSVLHLSGEATIGAVVELRMALLSVLDPSDRDFAIDLSAATRVDSSVIQLLIAVKRWAPQVRVLGVSAPQRQRWERLGLAGHLL
jgi:anti-anti-sigma regulatory factor